MEPSSEDTPKVEPLATGEDVLVEEPPIASQDMPAGNQSVEEELPTTNQDIPTGNQPDADQEGAISREEMVKDPAPRTGKLQSSLQTLVFNIYFLIPSSFVFSRTISRRGGDPSVKIFRGLDASYQDRVAQRRRLKAGHCLE